MSFIGDDNDAWWDDLDEDVSDDVRRILEDAGELPEVSDLEEIEEAEEDAEEPIEEFDDIDAYIEAAESEYLAPDNQADEDWEKVNHFDFISDAINYVAGVPVGILYIVLDEEGGADVYVDRDYEGASV